VNVQLNVATAFLAGLVSFVSPCVLPLIPAYLSFLTGSSLEELKAEQTSAQRARVMGHAIAFVVGFTVVFMALGFTAGAIGNALLQYRDIIARIGGIVVIILGLNMIGVFKIPFLMMDKRPQWRSANRSYLASFVVGLGFAAGWSPCIGPILAGILALASQQSFGFARSGSQCRSCSRPRRFHVRWEHSTGSSAISARSRSPPARFWSRPASCCSPEPSPASPGGSINT